MGYNINKKREEEIQELFLKNRINKRLERRIKIFWNIHIVIFILNIVYLYVNYKMLPDKFVIEELWWVSMNVIIFWCISVSIGTNVLNRCPYCGKFVGGSRRYGDKCPSCGETIAYYSSLEDMEKKKKEEKEQEYISRIF